MRRQLDENALLEFAKRVELIASRVLEGVHRSKRGGEGVEFHSANPFSQGEDVRRIDWKKFASTDRLYVRKFQREEKLSWQIILDGSESMNYGQKAEWARLWAASICFLANTWGDVWRLNSLEKTDFSHLIEDIFREDFQLNPKDFKKIEFVSRSDVIVVSDLFFDFDLLKAWKGVEAEVHSLHWIQVLDPRENEFDFKGVLQFLDMESSDKLVLDSKLVGKAYREALVAQQNELRARFPHSSFRVSIVEDSPIESQIVKFFEDL